MACRWRAECGERLRHLWLRGAVGAYADEDLTRARRTRVPSDVARCWARTGELLALQFTKASIRGRPHRTPTSLVDVRIRRVVGPVARTSTPPGR